MFAHSCRIGLEGYHAELLRAVVVEVRGSITSAAARPPLAVITPDGGLGQFADHTGEQFSYVGNGHRLAALGGPELTVVPEAATP